ncbi:MAG: right-handed parallel beta-helix repeat-containing protein, partial [Candidatus Woesearchaeota archaeon]|nr:right-handed parallel beta-helix repeat-containing protein [Candidatus Woesearchaeota archaeon]
LTNPKGSIIDNNKIKTIGSAAHCFYLYSNATDNIIEKNQLIATNGGYGMYIGLMSARNLITNNSITGTSGSGITLYFSSHNAFVDNDITTTSGAGFMLSSAMSNITIDSLRIKTTSGNALYLFDSLTNFTLNNSILNATTGADFYLTGGTGWGIWNFTNVTFNRSTWPAGATGTLNVKWLLDAYANYSNSSPAVGAHIVAWDNLTPTTSIFDAVTDGSGVIPQQVLMGYSQNGSTAATNITYYSNYTFNASVNLYTTLSQTQNMSTNRFLYFFFNNTPPTNVSLVSPSNSNSTVFNRTPFFNWTAATGGSGPITYIINITQQTCPDILVGSITGTNYTPTQDLCVDSLYNWTVTSYDGTNYGPVSDKWNFTIASTLILTMTTNASAFGDVQINQEYNTSYAGAPANCPC